MSWDISGTFVTKQRLSEYDGSFESLAGLCGERTFE